MKKMFLGMAVFFLSVILAFAEGGQDGGGSITIVNPATKVKIGVGLYQDTGPAVTAVKTFLASIENEVNCEFVYATLSMMDEGINKTAVQNLISAGCRGLILTMDSGTEAILDQCRKAGVVMAGFLSDYDISYNKIKTNPNFLGTVCDGAYLGTAWGEEMAARIIADGRRSVGVIKFPAFAYPHQSETDKAFRAKIAAHNSANPTRGIKLYDTIDLMFAPLDSTYFSGKSDLDAIFGICAGAEFIYPTQVATGKTSIKLYTGGYVATADIMNNFGTAGNGCIQEMRASNVDAIAYPLVLILNKLYGTPFTDQPIGADRIDASYITIKSDNDLALIRSRWITYTNKASDAFLSGSDVKSMLAVNGGSYAKLVQAIQTMSTADLAKR
jgi:hypothetical protein